MAEEKEADKPAGISDATVKARTGRSWSEWFAVLDEAGAVRVGHRGIVALVSEHHRVGPWWRQMVTVAYEQERGLRERHQTPEGFLVSASKTIGATLKAVFGAWADDGARPKWLRVKDLTVRRATPGRSMRITWPLGGSSVDINFYAKGGREEPGRG